MYLYMKMSDVPEEWERQSWERQPRPQMSATEWAVVFDSIKTLGIKTPIQLAYRDGDLRLVDGVRRIERQGSSTWNSFRWNSSSIHLSGSSSSRSKPEAAQRNLGRRNRRYLTTVGDCHANASRHLCRSRQVRASLQ